MPDIVIIKEPNNQVVVSGTNLAVAVQEVDQLAILQDTTNQVVIAASGAQGPPGPIFYYLHTQAIASTSWPVAHNLGRKPNTEVLVTGAGRVDLVRVDHIDDNNLVVTFGLAKAGEVICS